MGDREWKRRLGKDIMETYGWSYWSAGGRADWRLKTGEFSLYALYQEAFLAKMAATDLGKTSGCKIGAHWNGRLSKKVALEMEYVYDYWDILVKLEIITQKSDWSIYFRRVVC